MLTTIERAFQLAASGAFTDLTSLSKQLQQERYDSVRDHLAGRAIQKQLKKLMNEAAAQEEEQAEASPTA